MLTIENVPAVESKKRDHQTPFPGQAPEVVEGTMCKYWIGYVVLFSVLSVIFLIVGLFVI